MKLAVGFFDGVHLGHQAILRGADAALTFRRHPLSVLAPDRAPRLIMSSEERMAAIRSCGVRDVRILDFTPELADTEPEDFLPVLSACCPDGTLCVRCGENWHFGRGGRGNAAFLRERGVCVEVASYATYRDERISSSRIRQCLEQGQVADVRAMLGRPCQVCGKVVRGKGLGGQIGFPTINVAPGRPLCLRHGVYAVRLADRKGVANYGLAPTMGDRAWTEPLLEVHLLESAENLPLRTATVEIVGFVRDERAFPDLSALKAQIAADCLTAAAM